MATKISGVIWGGGGVAAAAGLPINCIINSSTRLFIGTIRQDKTED